MKLPLGILFSAIAAFLWSAAIIMSKSVLKEIDSNYLFLIQVVSSAFLSLIILTIKKQRLQLLTNIRMYLLGLFEPFLAYVLSLHGLTYVDAGISSVLFSMESIFILILSIILFKDEIKQINALVLISLTSMLGIVLISWNYINIGRTQIILGYFLVLAGVFMAAIYVTLSSKVVNKVLPVVLVTGQLIIASILSLMFLLPFISFKLINNQTLIIAILSGLCQYYFAFIFYLNSLKYLQVHIAGMMLYLIPVFTIIGSYYILGEILNGLQFLGCIIVLGSVFVTHTMFESQDSSEYLEK